MLEIMNISDPKNPTLVGKFEFTYFYLDNDRWIECPYNSVELKKNQLRIDRSQYYEIMNYFFNYHHHRLDGPAWIRKNLKILEIHTLWYVNGKLLHDFHNHYKTDSFQEWIFEYVKIWPHFTKEVELLARHNKWLNEDQINLLSCMDMFI
jgi:hypothetical protein